MTDILFPALPERAKVSGRILSGSLTLLLALAMYATVFALFWYCHSHTPPLAASQPADTISVTLIAAGTTKATASAPEPEPVPVAIERDIPPLAEADAGTWAIQPPKAQHTEKPKPKPVPVHKPVKPPKKIPPQKVVKPADSQIVAKPLQQTASQTENQQPGSDISNGDGGDARFTIRGGSAGTGASQQATGDSGAISRYAARLKAEIDRHKNYPSRSRRMQEKGAVIVGFTLLDNGAVSNVHLIDSSGYSSLDKAAMEAVREASSVGDRPAGMNAAQSVMVNFTQRNWD